MHDSNAESEKQIEKLATDLNQANDQLTESMVRNHSNVHIHLPASFRQLEV